MTFPCQFIIYVAILAQVWAEKDYLDYATDICRGVEICGRMKPVPSVGRTFSKRETPYTCCQGR